jgi:hypothetical protein
MEEEEERIADEVEERVGRKKAGRKRNMCISKKKIMRQKRKKKGKKYVEYEKRGRQGRKTDIFVLPKIQRNSNTVFSRV